MQPTTATRGELSPAEIQAIVALLADGDERTDQMITAQLLERPTASRHAVLTGAEAAGVWTTMRLARVVRQNRREELAAQFAALERDGQGDVDLEEAALLLACIGTQQPDATTVGQQLDQWAEDVHMAMSAGEPRQGLDALRTVLFSRLRFHGEHDFYHVPENSFLPHVMKTKVGLPITLAVVVLLVAKRVGLPVEGIGMPGHFVLRYALPDPEAPVYIDVFEQGTRLTEKACYRMVRRMGLPPEGALDPVGPTVIIARMLNNLAAAYQLLEDAEGVADCEACVAGLATIPAGTRYSR